MAESTLCEVKVKVKNENGDGQYKATVVVSGCGENAAETYTATTGYDNSAVFNLLPGKYNITASKNEYNSNTLTSVSIEGNTELEIIIVTEGVILFGSYPQSEVTDSDLLSELNSLSLNWSSYGYYSGTSNDWGAMKPGDWMLYADVSYRGEKYRAVRFTRYRPERTFWMAMTDDAAYGYYINTVYWFKYEPIQWIVPDSEDGLILSRHLIDAQPFNNVLDSDISKKIKDAPNDYEAKRYCYFNGTGNYASDYAASSIRIWLNNDFYNTAFTPEEKEQISIATLDNSCRYPEYPMLNSATTHDKIFLPSDKEFETIKNNVYESSGDVLYNDIEIPDRTNYAKCQGRYSNTCWWLRTPGDYSDAACMVSYQCYISGNGNKVDYIESVRPALMLNPDAEIFKSYVSNSSDEPDLKLNSGLQLYTAAEQQMGKINLVSDVCIPHQQYVVLNVTGYGADFKLSAENLYYINTVTSDENGVVSVSFIQKQFDENSTTLLIGDFGNGTEIISIKPKVNINNPSVTTIKYGDTLVLHAVPKHLPEGAIVLWTVEGDGVSIAPSKDGLTCNVTSVKTGTVTVTARIVDKDGKVMLDENGKEISASQTLTSKAGLWQKIVSFFKNLFGIDRIIEQRIEFDR